MPNNGDTEKEFLVNGDIVRGIGSFHKTLPHNPYGEACSDAFKQLVDACNGDGSGFASVPEGLEDAAKLTNPQAGLAADHLTHHPAAYSMPPAPTVLSTTTAAEMTELYWMALLRDIPFNELQTNQDTGTAAEELNTRFHDAVSDTSDPGHLRPGIDIPGSSATQAAITRNNLFRLGLAGEENGPMLSQFFTRPVAFGTQVIDARQRPYKAGHDYLTKFDEWLRAQCTGKDDDGRDYSKANEGNASFFEDDDRYISTMRDLARFVNKDALHQAYFNAALILLSGQAELTTGNPYREGGQLAKREAGFGVLGGPHLLALVSEVATRALKVIWNQKWQVNLRLRPEAYGGLVHVQTDGVCGVKRQYGLPEWVTDTHAAKKVSEKTNGNYLLPMAFTPGGPNHPAYGAGHATVAGACVTILKAYFKTFEMSEGNAVPVKFNTLQERTSADGNRPDPFDTRTIIKAYETGCYGGEWKRVELEREIAEELTIEGELNKLAQNVSMGRSMGGVHWRTDNSRSLVLGEAIAAEILAGITTDTNEEEYFEFRTFARREDGSPKIVRIQQGRIFVDGRLVDTHTSAL